MENIKIYKIRGLHFCASFHHFRDIHIHTVDLQRVGQGHEYNFLQCFHLIAKIKTLTGRHMHCVLSPTISEILMFQIFDLKIRPSSQSTVFVMLSFDGKYKNLQVVP